MEKKLFIESEFETKSSTEDKRTVEFIVSKEIVDRVGDLVKIKGIDIKEYKENPIVMFSHMHSDLPIGKAIKISKFGDEMKVNVQFPEAETYLFADTVYKLCKGGYLKGISIGIIPDYKSNEYPDNKKLNGKAVNRIINKSKLFELSICAVPMNQAALATGKSLTKAVEDGVLSEVELKEYNDKCKDVNTVSDKEQIINLKSKVAELELTLKEYEMEAEIEDDIYTELYKEFADDKKVDSDVVDELYKEFIDIDNGDDDILNEYL